MTLGLRSVQDGHEKVSFIDLRSIYIAFDSHNFELYHMRCIIVYDTIMDKFGDRFILRLR